MSRPKNSPPSHPMATSGARQSNLAQRLLDSKIFRCLFPIIAYVVAVLIQTRLNDLVGIQYGSSVLYLSFGVRLFTALIFGFAGLLWMVLGQIFIFTFYPSPYYIDHPVESFVLSCTYSLIAYFAVEFVRGVRNLGDEFDDVSTVDVLLITLISSFVASITHFAILGDHFSDPLYNMFLSFLSKLTGSMIGFLGLMLAFSLLYQIKTPKGS